MQNEGDIGVKAPRPYEISLGSIMPPVGNCENLVVPVCIVIDPYCLWIHSHGAGVHDLGSFGNCRRLHAIDRGCSVQEVPYAALRAQLLAEGQVLEYK